jgi:SAM-dependent methyltransferase
MLIRWIGTEVRIFAYLQNTVLVVCFLGLGMGCFTSHKPVAVRNILIPLLGLVLLLALPPTRAVLAKITNLLSVLDDLAIWEHAISDGWSATLLRVTGGLGLTLGLMILIWEMFVPIGRLLGRLMDSREQVIWAYSVNVGGSLLGIWLFVGLSAFSLPPLAWLLVACGLLLPFIGAGRVQVVNLGLISALLLAGIFVGYDSNALETHWSPYQKLVLKEVERAEYGWEGKLISVNNAGYQGMIDLDPERLRKDPSLDASLIGLSQYDLPLRLKPNPERVLIVGAGSGNDAAGALRGGAQHVTAVEIDSAIVDMGRRHHPERPYDSPRVRIVVDDARSFFATTTDRYDLIIFGLLDSHTTTAMTNARLDHYVYTRESIARARDLLAPGGVMVLSFEAFKPYISDRMARCLRGVFGHDPLTFRMLAGRELGWGGVMFVVGDQPSVHSALASDKKLADWIARCQKEHPIELTYQTAICTDDWPYLYLKQARIPTLYFLLAGLMGVLLYYGQRRLEIPRLLGDWTAPDWHFFFMGAAFLLLEVQNISKASVVLGNTWIVSAVIISAVLLMILLANCIFARFGKLPLAAVWVPLIGSCLAIYLVDLSSFAFLYYPVKAAVVGALTTLPMLFAGMIFIESFGRVEHKDRALGANLLGSLVGGMLQSLTFVIGIKALLLVVAGLYLGAWLTRSKLSAPPARPDDFASDSTEELPEQPEASEELAEV